MFTEIDKILNFELFLKNKDFAFKFSKNNEITLNEFIEFLNKILKTRITKKLSKKSFTEAIEKNKLKSMKGHVKNDVLMIQELKNLGYDWVVMSTSVEMENQIVCALKGKFSK